MYNVFIGFYHPGDDVLRWLPERSEEREREKGRAYGNYLQRVLVKIISVIERMNSKIIGSYAEAQNK